MEPGAKDPWLRWAAFVVPAFSMAMSWRLTEALPFVTRIAIGVAVAVVIYGVVYVLAKGPPR